MEPDISSVSLCQSVRHYQYYEPLIVNHLEKALVEFSQSARFFSIDNELNVYKTCLIWVENNPVT
jgi:hypothetical protein